MVRLNSAVAVAIGDTVKLATDLSKSWISPNALDCKPKTGWLRANSPSSTSTARTLPLGSHALTVPRAENESVDAP